MRTFAIALNILLLATAGYSFARYGMGNDRSELLLVLLVFLAPVVNILAILVAKENWLTLYLQRKALEEKLRIEGLNSNRKI